MGQGLAGQRGGHRRPHAPSTSRGHSVGREINNANGNPTRDQALTALPLAARRLLSGPIFRSMRTFDTASVASE